MTKEPHLSARSIHSSCRDFDSSPLLLIALLDRSTNYLKPRGYLLDHIVNALQSLTNLTDMSYQYPRLSFLMRASRFAGRERVAMYASHLMALFVDIDSS